MATEISQIGKVAAITKLFEGTGYTNDTTIPFSSRGKITSIQKVFIEGIDFDLTYNPLQHLGYKLTLNLIGELYARIANPLTLNVTVALSNRFSFEDCQQLWNGITAAAKEHKIKAIALDLIPSSKGLIVSFNTVGEILKRTIDKTPAPTATDLILLSGNVGAAYMGLHVLEREKVAFQQTANGVTPPQPKLDKYKYILEQYLSPSLDPQIITRLQKIETPPSKGYFVANSLGAAVRQLSLDSGFGARIYLEKIPIATKTFEMAKELDMDPITAAINGGDDYKLLITIPVTQFELYHKEFQEFDIIGHLASPQEGCSIVTPEGAHLELKAQGY
ncbi:MAG: hypothetical protein IIY14_00485 [Bacteroidales bacterium]|jgi:thiamine-monophosphate kinase|nr:hypothetical protein [Bacteroidales bacterium]MBQ5882162.1 hypothetical protein [Bacteroidales bacterium]